MLRVRRSTRRGGCRWSPHGKERACGTWPPAAFGGLVLGAIMLTVAHKPLKPVQWIISVLIAGALVVTGLVHVMPAAKRIIAMEPMDP